MLAVLTASSALDLFVMLSRSHNRAAVTEFADDGLESTRPALAEEPTPHPVGMESAAMPDGFLAGEQP